MRNIRALNDGLYTDFSIEELEERLEMAESSCSSFECIQQNNIEPQKPGTEAPKDLAEQIPLP